MRPLRHQTQRSYETVKFMLAEGANIVEANEKYDWTPLYLTSLLSHKLYWMDPQLKCVRRQLNRIKLKLAAA